MSSLRSSEQGMLSIKRLSPLFPLGSVPMKVGKDGETSKSSNILKVTEKNIILIYLDPH